MPGGYVSQSTESLKVSHENEDTLICKPNYQNNGSSYPYFATMFFDFRNDSIVSKTHTGRLPYFPDETWMLPKYVLLKYYVGNKPIATRRETNAYQGEIGDLFKVNRCLTRAGLSARLALHVSSSEIGRHARHPLYHCFYKIA